MSDDEDETFMCYVPRSLYKYYAISELQCTFVQTGLWLNNFHFGYICVAILAIIILISIFGKIKENYRWFILNQALWDLLMCYDYIDNNKLQHYYSGMGDEDIGGFDRFIPLQYQTLFSKIMETQPYSSLFLLCSTRFLCLFFMHFYEKLTQKRRILYFILIFNFICIFVHINFFLKNWLDERLNYLDDECFSKAKNQKQRAKCDQEQNLNKFFYSDFLQIVLKILYTVFNFIVEFKSTFFILFSIIATFMIIFKIGKQAKFQLQHNPKDFLSSLRVSSVMTLQTLLYIFVFFISLLKSLISFQELFNISVDFTGFFCYDGAVLCIQIILPEWMWSDDYGLGDPRILQTFVQLRIFLESIIVLSLMTGYREAIFKFFKFLFHSTSKPLFERYIKFNSGSFSTTVSVISTRSANF